MTLGNVASFNEVAFRDSSRGTQLKAIWGSPLPAARGMSDSFLLGEIWVTPQDSKEEVVKLTFSATYFCSLTNGFSWNVWFFPSLAVLDF